MFHQLFKAKWNSSPLKCDRTLLKHTGILSVNAKNTVHMQIDCQQSFSQFFIMFHLSAIANDTFLKIPFMEKHCYFISFILISNTI